jgi:hypothetical protein
MSWTQGDQGRVLAIVVERIAARDAPNLLAHYFYLFETTVVRQAIEQRGFLPRQADIRRVTGAGSYMDTRHGSAAPRARSVAGDVSVGRGDSERPRSGISPPARRRISPRVSRKSRISRLGKRIAGIAGRCGGAAYERAAGSKSTRTECPNLLALFYL